MMATIKDVARRANVSTATVSLVLHNNKRITDFTRRRVLKAVQDLDYHPSRVARGLVLRKTNNIGFILTDDHFLKTEPFYTHIFLGTEFEARGHKYYVLLNTIQSEFNEQNCLPRFVKERNVDGIIINRIRHKAKFSSLWLAIHLVSRSDPKVPHEYSLQPKKTAGPLSGTPCSTTLLSQFRCISDARGPPFLRGLG